MSLGKTPYDRLSQQYIDGGDAVSSFCNGNIWCWTDKLLLLCIFICFYVGLCNHNKWYEHGEHCVLDNTHDHEMSNTDRLGGIDALVEGR